MSAQNGTTEECPKLPAAGDTAADASKMMEVSAYSSSEGGPPSEVETRVGGGSRTSGLSESGSGGEGTSESGSGSGENENGRSGPCAHHKKEKKGKQLPSEVNALRRSESETRSNEGGSSGLSSEYGSGSGGDDEDSSDTSEDKKMPAKKADSPLSALSGAASKARPKEEEEKLQQEQLNYVQYFMSALLALKPKLSEQQKKAIQQKAKEKRERKRKVNRLSAQRKRIREREVSALLERVSCAKLLFFFSNFLSFCLLYCTTTALGYSVGAIEGAYRGKPSSQER